MIDISDIDRAEIPALLIILAARLLEPIAPAQNAPEAAADEDRLLSTAEAALMLGHSSKWIYRHVADLPFARRIGPRDLRFSLHGLRKWQAGRR